MCFSSKEGEFDWSFNRLDRPVEESRPYRQRDRPVDPTDFDLWSQVGTETNGFNCIFANKNELGRKIWDTSLLPQAVLISSIKLISSRIYLTMTVHTLERSIW